MTIGNHTYWIVVDLYTQLAITPKDDKRAAYRFVSRISARDEKERQARENSEDEGRFIVVEVAA